MVARAAAGGSSGLSCSCYWKEESGSVLGGAGQSAGGGDAAVTARLLPLLLLLELELVPLHGRHRRPPLLQLLDHQQPSHLPSLLQLRPPRSVNTPPRTNDPGTPTRKPVRPPASQIAARRDDLGKGKLLSQAALTIMEAEPAETAVADSGEQHLDAEGEEEQTSEGEGAAAQPEEAVGQEKVVFRPPPRRLGPLGGKERLLESPVLLPMMQVSCEGTKWHFRHWAWPARRRCGTS